ncbi:folate-binding protein YgfZ [Mesorhizobium sp. CGMCC 1.15528]|uniref:Folate-binding protein YgfZ n=1 Tax=Mesorhizobium zhangyense TaxID=1776730 RepID=A0A7C9VAV6_9HYPH|nr:folate-binding protein YgfZ [Mesorhizobium zhangyense]NGN40692.1 folate-binding protein YgfZ [Mesorhizobium zhangyense]
MPAVQLPDRILISVSGPDAEHFLQNILTTDLDALSPEDAKPGALLTPQGKILFDFLVSRDGNGGLLLECRTEIADDFIRRLTLYKLRAKVDISKQEQSLVSVSWNLDSDASVSDSSASETDSTVRHDRRFVEPARVFRIYGQTVPEGDQMQAWEDFRLAHGIAESGSDYALSDAFPHDVLLDQTGGVGFGKGCYVGQEVVSRMHHRGTARRRVLLVSAEEPLPPSGTDIKAAGKTIGTLGSVSGNKGLAIVRIDRVKDAIDAGIEIAVGEVAVSLTIPGWAKFTFPQEPAAAEDA